MLRDQESLIDIVEAIKLILRYVEGVSFATLATNVEKQDAILRRIIIIGEATKRLSKDFREQHSTIPWKEIAGMRDVIPMIMMKLTLTRFGLLLLRTYLSY